jgi:recombination protein RecR
MKNPLDELTQSFMKFPGIGRRQAKRFAYFIIQSEPGWVHQLAQQMLSVQKNMKLDPISFQYFSTSDPTVTHSPLTRDPKRDKSLLMIVEKDVDIEALEKSGAYQGHYFVLGGLAPLIDTDIDKTIRLQQLLRVVVQKIQDSDSPLREIIFALSANPEGDRTARLLQQKLVSLEGSSSVTFSQLGRGFSTGTEVEYSDPETIMYALTSRRKSE